MSKILAKSSFCLRVLKFIFVLFYLAASPAQAASSEIIEKNKSDFVKIEEYLQNIKYLNADFIQESPDGAAATGKFYLARPGKMRVEYDTPTKILIIVNGSVLSYEDVELEETSHVSTNSTPASLLTRKVISFSASDVEVTRFSKVNGIISISLVKKNKKEAGEFTLVFKENPVEFIRMEVRDDMDQITKFTLKNHDFYNKINKNMFVIKNDQLP